MLVVPPSRCTSNATSPSVSGAARSARRDQALDEPLACRAALRASDRCREAERDANDIVDTRDRKARQLAGEDDQFAGQASGEPYHRRGDLVSDGEAVRLEQVSHRRCPEALQHDHGGGMAEPLDSPPVTCRHENDERPKSQLLGNEYQEVGRDVVDEVTIVDDQHDRLLPGRTGEERGNVLEQSRAAGAQAFDQLLPGAELAHDRRPRPAGYTSGDRVARHPQHPDRNAPCLFCEHLGEGGLARAARAQQHEDVAMATLERVNLC